MKESVISNIPCNTFLELKDPSSVELMMKNVCIYIIWRENCASYCLLILDAFYQNKCSGTEFKMQMSSVCKKYYLNKILKHLFSTFLPMNCTFRILSLLIFLNGRQIKIKLQLIVSKKTNISNLLICGPK